MPYQGPTQEQLITNVPVLIFCFRRRRRGEKISGYFVVSYPDSWVNGGRAQWPCCGWRSAARNMNGIRACDTPYLLPGNLFVLWWTVKSSPCSHVKIPVFCWRTVSNWCTPKQEKRTSIVSKLNVEFYWKTSEDTNCDNACSLYWPEQALHSNCDQNRIVCFALLQYDSK